MDEIEVDPKLFVTCRLCLEDMGQYQIVPSVQQQIKYCFAIDVEPFDGLPQLICMKCKEILNKFHTIKTTFCEKQSNLINKVIKKDEKFNFLPQQDTVSSSQQAPEIIEPKQLDDDVPNISKKVKTKRKRLLLRSSSSSDLESEQSFQTSTHQKKKSSRLKGPMAWEIDYKKSIACKLCNSVWPNRISLAVHSRRSHDLLRVKYKNILSRQCTVNLIKIDDKPNLTGLTNVVVHSSNKIVAPGDSYYFTIYSKDDLPSNNEFNSAFIEKEDENFSGESSGEEELLFKPSHRKKRILSRSSNETVVIESNSNKMLSDEENSKITARNSIAGPLTNDDCINIDDSSNSESEPNRLEKSEKLKQPVEAKIGDYKIIQGIISMCVNSYNKKNESSEVDMLYVNVNQNKKKDNLKISSESQLKHKVLSIGRKIINKQGFNCTGLLRYMEQKNLEIVWIAKAQVLNQKDTNYIRILTKLRGDLHTDNAPGWVNVHEVPQPKSYASVSLLKNVSASSDATVSKNSQSSLINDEKSQPEKIINQAYLELPLSLPAMLYLESNGSTSDSKKLLNANPVANPKQLPKKMGQTNEARSNKTIAQQSVCQTSNDDDINFCLPIITSTTSLATVPSKEQIPDANQINTITSEESKKPETTAPRIKVKPASELMSQKTLNSMKEQTMTVNNSNMFVSPVENAWPSRRPLNVYVPNNVPSTMLVISPPPLTVLQMPTLGVNTAYQAISGPITSNTKTEYVILDSTDFPNTKTESPIKYVKDLLQLHNLFLLDPNEVLSDKFLSLIKFKVVFKQDHQKDSPVILCLSLLCFKNTFSFQVKDRNQEIIDMTKISANWQWEIIQTYCGDVSNKVLQNARKFGQETFDYTNNFFCLLKTINCRKPC